MSLKSALEAAVVGFLLGGLILAASIAYVEYKTPVTMLDTGSIVRLVDSNGETFCTGSVVRDDYIITAGHCVVEQGLLGVSLKKDPIGIRISDNVDIGVKGTAVYAMSQMDRGLIKGDFKNFPHAKMITDIHDSLELRKTSKTLFACGYPLHGKLYCSNYTPYDVDGFIWGGYGTLLPGMSGGPLTTINNEVLGVNISVEGNKSFVSPIYNLDMEMKDKP
jgi:Trypsin